MNKDKVDKIKAIKDKALKIINPLNEQLETYHKQNKELSEKIYPSILEAIESNLFNKGLCIVAKFEYLTNVSKSMGDHWQLLPLGDIIKYDPNKEYSFEDGAICRKDQLDPNDYVLKVRLLNRYFSHYYPNYDLLKSELDIDLSKINQ